MEGQLTRQKFVLVFYIFMFFTTLVSIRLFYGFRFYVSFIFYTIISNFTCKSFNCTCFTIFTISSQLSCKSTHAFYPHSFYLTIIGIYIINILIFYRSYCSKICPQKMYFTLKEIPRNNANVRRIIQQNKYQLNVMEMYPIRFYYTSITEV